MEWTKQQGNPEKYKERLRELEAIGRYRRRIVHP